MDSFCLSFYIDLLVCVGNVLDLLVILPPSLPKCWGYKHALCLGKCVHYREGSWSPGMLGCCGSGMLALWMGCGMLGF